MCFRVSIPGADICMGTYAWHKIGCGMKGPLEMYRIHGEYMDWKAHWKRMELESPLE